MIDGQREPQEHHAARAGLGRTACRRTPRRTGPKRSRPARGVRAGRDARRDPASRPKCHRGVAACGDGPSPKDPARTGVLPRARRVGSARPGGRPHRGSACASRLARRGRSLLPAPGQRRLRRPALRHLLQLLGAEPAHGRAHRHPRGGARGAVPLRPRPAPPHPRPRGEGQRRAGALRPAGGQGAGTRHHAGARAARRARRSPCRCTTPGTPTRSATPTTRSTGSSAPTTARSCSTSRRARPPGSR